MISRAKKYFFYQNLFTIKIDVLSPAPVILGYCIPFFLFFSAFFSMPTSENAALFPCLVIPSTLESLRNDGGDAEDETHSKMNLYFTSEIRNCLDLFSTSMAVRSDKINMQ